MVALVSAHRLIGKTTHACDFVDEEGEDVDTSMSAENLESDAFQNMKIDMVQLGSKIRIKQDDDDTVEGARTKFALMQQEMEDKIAAADAKREE